MFWGWVGRCVLPGCVLGFDPCWPWRWLSGRFVVLGYLVARGLWDYIV